MEGLSNWYEKETEEINQCKKQTALPGQHPSNGLQTLIMLLIKFHVSLSPFRNVPPDMEFFRKEVVLYQKEQYVADNVKDRTTFTMKWLLMKRRPVNTVSDVDIV